MTNQKERKNGECVNVGLFGVKARLCAPIALLLQSHGLTRPLGDAHSTDRLAVKSFVVICVALSTEAGIMGKGPGMERVKTGHDHGCSAFMYTHLKKMTLQSSFNSSQGVIISNLTFHR